MNIHNENVEAKTLSRHLSAMDPFYALGLAGNVIQFVDFGGGLLSGSLELYKSVDGTSSTNKELEFPVKNLNELCAGLSRPEHRIDQQQASAPELALLPLLEHVKSSEKSCYLSSTR